LNGRYIVSAIGTTTGNDTVVAYLRKSLLGHEFDFAIDSTTVTVRSLTTHNQFTLKRWRDAKLLTYIGHMNVSQGGQYLTILKRDTGFNMDVSLTIPSSVILPVQYGGFNINALTRSNSKYGRIVCYLNKVNN